MLYINNNYSQRQGTYANKNRVKAPRSTETAFQKGSTNKIYS